MLAALYNISPFVVSNSGFGDVLLSTDDLVSLTNGYTESAAVTISGTVEIDVDFLARYSISEIRYYYSGESEITIQYSQDGDIWSEFSTEYNYGYASVSGELSPPFDSWPSVLRITHTPLAGLANIYEIDVTNRDEDRISAVTSVSVDTSEDSGVSRVLLYNTSCLTPVDIHCFVDSELAYSSGVMISDSESGEFYNLFEKGLSLPRDFAWGNGILSGVVVSGTSVILDSVSGTGYYESPIFDIDQMGPFRVFWIADEMSDSYIDYTDFLDGAKTIGVRCSNIAPVGIWESGQCSTVDDAVWGTLSGTLQYFTMANGEIYPGPLGRERYFQMKVKLVSENVGQTPVLTNMGLSEAVTVSGVAYNSSEAVYIKTSFDSYVAGSSSGLLSFINK